MPTTVTISGVQREVFYELVLDHLSGIADLSLAVERGTSSPLSGWGSNSAKTCG